MESTDEVKHRPKFEWTFSLGSVATLVAILASFAGGVSYLKDTQAEAAIARQNNIPIRVQSLEILATRNTTRIEALESNASIDRARLVRIEDKLDRLLERQ